MPTPMIVTGTDRKEHLARCASSLEEEVKRLSQLFQTKDLRIAFEQVLGDIREFSRLLSQFALSEAIYVPGVGGKNVLLSQIANIGIGSLVSAISDHVRNTTPLSGRQAELITRELVRQNPQAAIQQIFTLFEDCLRQRIDAGPELYGEPLINAAFGNHGVLTYGETPAEQVGIRNLLAGAYATFRNPHMHRMIEDNEKTTLAIITIVDLLINIIGEAQNSS